MALFFKKISRLFLSKAEKDKINIRNNENDRITVHVPTAKEQKWFESLSTKSSKQLTTELVKAIKKDAHWKVETILLVNNNPETKAEINLSSFGLLGTLADAYIENRHKVVVLVLSDKAFSNDRDHKQLPLIDNIISKINKVKPRAPGNR